MGRRHWIRSSLVVAGVAGVVGGSLVTSHAALASTRTYGPPRSIAGVSLNDAQGIAADASGNVYVTDAGNDRVLELSRTASGFGAVATLPFSGLNAPGDVGVDALGSVFVATGSGVTELPKTAGGFGPQVTLPFQGLTQVTSMAVDPDGNVYVAANRGQVLKLSVSPGGAVTQAVLPFGNLFAIGVAVDGSGNVYAVGNGALDELPAAGAGYGPLEVLPSVGIGDVTSIALDGAGNIFVGSDAVGGVVDELTKTSSGWAPSAQAVYLYFYSSQSVSALAVDPTGDLLATGSTGQGLESEATELAAAHLDPNSPHFNSVPSKVLPFDGVNVPRGLAIDSAGDVFVSDGATPIYEGNHHSWLANVVEYPRGTHSSERVVPFQGLNVVDGLAVDPTGDVFAAAFGPYGAEVFELSKTTSGFGAQTTIPFGQIIDRNGDIVTATGLALDSAGDVFMSWSGDEGLDFGIAEVPVTPGGYGPVVKLPLTGDIATTGLAADRSGDIFASGKGAVIEFPKLARGFGAQKTIDSRLPVGAASSATDGIALDGSGDIFIADAPDGTVLELPHLSSGYGAPITLQGTGISQPDQVALGRHGDVFAAGDPAPSSGHDSTVAELPART